MIVSYTHEDGSVEEVSTDDLSAVESGAVERVTGDNWTVIEQKLRLQDPTAMRAVLWTHRKRSLPTLKFSEFDLPRWRRRLKARLERHEVEETALDVLSEDETEKEREETLRQFRKLAHDPADVDEVWAEAMAPKDLAPPPAEAHSTSGPSPISSTSTGA